MVHIKWTLCDDTSGAHYVLKLGVKHKGPDKLVIEDWRSHG